MGVKVQTYGSDIKRKAIDKLYAGMVIARGHLEKHIKDITPIITGNLRNSTYGDTIEKTEGAVKTKVWQAAHYAIFVEARKFHFTTGMRFAEQGIKEIFQKVRL
jgi:hypothetical protein